MGEAQGLRTILLRASRTGGGAHAQGEIEPRRSDLEGHRADRIDDGTSKALGYAGSRRPEGGVYTTKQLR